jgi:hypothetical protein
MSDPKVIGTGLIECSGGSKLWVDKSLRLTQIATKTDLANAESSISSKINTSNSSISSTIALLSTVQILSVAPAAIPGRLVLWMLDTEYAAGDYKIRVVFPDGTDKGVYLPFSYL